MDNVEKNLEKLMESLATALSKENLPNDFDEIVDELKQTYICKNAETASTCLFFKIEKFEDQLVKQLMPKYENVPRKNLWKLEYLWQHFSQVEHYVSSFVEKFEGCCCSVDKGRWLLNKYMNYLIKEEIPDMKKKEKEYWKPSFGTFEEWYKFIDGYIESRYRYSHEFVLATAKLIEATEKNKNIREVKEYFKTLNLNDFDLGGVEIVEEDFERMAEDLNKGNSVKSVVDDYLNYISFVLNQDSETIED